MPLNRDREFVICAALRYQFDLPAPDAGILDVIEAWAPFLSAHALEGFVRDIDADRKWGMRRRLPEVLQRFAAMERAFQLAIPLTLVRPATEKCPEDTLYLCAVKYACGRTSTAPSIVTDCLVKDWGALSQDFRAAIVHYVRTRLDDGRAGDPCDIACWNRILPLSIT